MSRFISILCRERWSDSRERPRDRHRDRDRYRDSDRESYRDSDRDSYRDSDRDPYREVERERVATRHNYNEDFHHGQHSSNQQQNLKNQQQLPQFNPSYSQPDFWQQAAQQVIEGSLKVSLRLSTWCQNYETFYGRNLHSTRLERLSRDKHSSLLRKFVKYGRKKFYRINP